jgi:peptidyl-dipeptidase A
MGCSTPPIEVNLLLFILGGNMRPSLALLVALFFVLTACTEKVSEQLSSKDFLLKADQDLKQESQMASLASWVQSNFITPDTTKLSAEYSARYSKLVTDLALESKNYRGKDKNEKRMLDLMLKVLTVPSPRSPQLNKELSTLKSELESLYGSGQFCDNSGSCQSLEDLESVIGTSRDPEELLKAWEGWRTVAVPMKNKFKRTVELGNQGAQELGFAHMADLWRSNYDMKPEDFEKELDRLWLEVRPFYEQLHCYVRKKLNQKYGDSIVKMDEPIPAHLLGNMWGQSWSKIMDVVAPDQKESVDITQLLKKADYNPKKMVETAENFFVSIGMPRLPKSFYDSSLFEKPKDREVVCHASAWHMDAQDDVRIKMCILIDEESFRTIHHELGHIYYYLAYKDLPILYQGSANDGFHEALGDTIELSITSQYLKEISLLTDSEQQKPEAHEVLLPMALNKVAFLPFGLMIDKWRWQVFDGRTRPDDYNDDWWNLRQKYQGLKPPKPRPTEAFDPGAKYHIPGYTPYSRYFIAHILQFQFHRSLCETAGHQGPLHECSIFNSQKAGGKLWNMMKMGTSRPWPEALAAVTGNPKMDASALRDYFAPLERWLSEQNRGLQCGW